MRSRLWLTPGTAIALAIAIALGGVVPPHGARVSGGIVRCQVLSERLMPGESRYVAGYVELLKGDVRLRADPDEPGVLRDVLPSEVVAQQSVGWDDQYSFDVPPGRYVLYAPQSAGVSNAYRYVEVNLNPGDDVIVDIPNTCL